MKTIKFKDTDFILTGDLENGGAITTIKDYESGRISYAHLYENGIIKRFNQVIGSVDGIEVIGEYEPDKAEYELNIFKDKVGKYRWRFVCTNNGEIMAISSQGYGK